MEELNKEYTILFNGITETIRGLETTVHRLKLLQLAAENTYLDKTNEDYEMEQNENHSIVLETEKTRVNNSM